MERKLRALAYELTASETRERERIALGLHDDIGQLLAMAHIRLSQLRDVVQSNGDEWAACLTGEVLGYLREAITATRTATFDLHSPALRQLGLKAALECAADRMSKAGSRIDMNVVGDLPCIEIPQPDLAVLYRVVRELMFNVHKHSRAQNATVRIAMRERSLQVRVEDDGVGFTAGSHGALGSGGYGLMSAHAQMHAIGGSLELGRSPSGGALAIAAVPLSASDQGRN